MHNDHDNPFDAPRQRLARVQIHGAELLPGDRVLLRPSRRADIMDTLLAGKTATITSIEQDFENRVHIAVALDDDPGRDLAMSGQPGHRFFFAPEEIELLEPPEPEIVQ